MIEAGETLTDGPIAATAIEQSEDLFDIDEPERPAKRQAGPMLSPEARAIIDAINQGPLNQKIDSLKSSVDSVESNVNDLKRKVEAHDGRLDALEKKVAAAAAQPPSSAVSSGGFSDLASTVGHSAGPRQVLNPYQAQHAVSQGYAIPAALLPFHLRRTLVFGGWERDTESASILADLDRILFGVQELESKQCSGRYNSIAKVNFKTVDSMWRFIKSRSGKIPITEGPNVGAEIWFSIEKSDEERISSARTSKAIFLLKEMLGAAGHLHADPKQQIKQIPADYVRGIVWFKPNIENREQFRIVEKPKGDDQLKICTGYDASGFPADRKQQFIDAVNAAA